MGGTHKPVARGGFNYIDVIIHIITLTPQAALSHYDMLWHSIGESLDESVAMENRAAYTASRHAGYAVHTKGNHRYTVYLPQLFQGSGLVWMCGFCSSATNKHSNAWHDAEPHAAACHHHHHHHHVTH
jgi:hypothetical protein